MQCVHSLVKLGDWKADLIRQTTGTLAEQAMEVLNTNVQPDYHFLF